MTSRKLAALCVALPACASFEGLSSRAAYDLQCGPEAIHAEWLANQTAVASGCGREAVYVNHCQPYLGCSWLLNSDVRKSTAPEPRTALPAKPPAPGKQPDTAGVFETE